MVPPAVRRQAGLKSGDKLAFKVPGQVITIRLKPATGDDTYTPAQRRAIDHGIAQSEKEYAAGKSYGPFETAEEANSVTQCQFASEAGCHKEAQIGQSMKIDFTDRPGNAA